MRQKWVAVDGEGWLVRLRYGYSGNRLNKADFRQQETE